ncbi:hypothetical protein [Streptomyces sp. NPDC088789]|uniref:hypothetical protein n=1 Tax=Streptomyces sp. NPDC088789 TaxID=3365899 RepID=UPI0038250752
MIIREGMIFTTIAEKGCVALGDSDEEGNFRGRDSQGVECDFTTAMVLSARPPGFHVVARLEVDGTTLHVTDQVAVSVSPSMAAQELKAQPAEMFGVWEVGETRPTDEEAEERSQTRLPQSVYVYVGGELWLLDDMYTGVTTSPCRG